MRGGDPLKKRVMIWLILSFIVLVFGAFGYGYYSTLKNISREKTDQRKETGINYKFYDQSEMEDEVNRVPEEDRVTPSTVLEKKIISINTGKALIEYSGPVPEEIVNFNREQVTDFFGSYKVDEFSRDKITVLKEMPYLPDHFIVKLENSQIVVFKTDSKGQATKYEEFEPMPYKNRDINLERGIEVKTEEEIWEKIRDYD